MWGAVSVQKFMAVTVQFSPEIFLDYTPNHISSNDTLKSVAYRANPFIHLKVSKSERHYNVFHLHDSPTNHAFSTPLNTGICCYATRWNKQFDMNSRLLRSKVRFEVKNSLR